MFGFLKGSYVQDQMWNEYAVSSKPGEIGCVRLAARVDVCCQCVSDFDSYGLVTERVVFFFPLLYLETIQLAPSSTLDHVRGCHCI